MLYSGSQPMVVWMVWSQVQPALNAGMVMIPPAGMMVV